jgi:hypothetical protein
MSIFKHQGWFHPDDPNSPPDWRELHKLSAQFEDSTDSDERFELGRRITELSKRVLESGQGLQRARFLRDGARS